MSHWADLENALNTTVLATFGDPVTVTQGATTTEVIAVITKLSGPWLQDGQLQISQHAYQALILINELGTEPVLGTTLTTVAGQVYAVDQPPTHDNGVYRLVLKRRP